MRFNVIDLCILMRLLVLDNLLSESWSTTPPSRVRKDCRPVPRQTLQHSRRCWYNFFALLLSCTRRAGGNALDSTRVLIPTCSQKKNRGQFNPLYALLVDDR